MHEFLVWQGWPFFFLAWAFVAFLFAALPLGDTRGEHQTVGAFLLLMEWFITRIGTQTADKLNVAVDLAVIDAGFAVVFLWMALKHKAIWASIVVVAHLGMALGHLEYFTGGLTWLQYMLWLNLWFGISLLASNTGVWAARYDPRRSLDKFINHWTLHLTFSGFSFARHPNNK